MENESITFESITAELECSTEHVILHPYTLYRDEAEAEAEVLFVARERVDLVRAEMGARKATNETDLYKPMSFYKSAADLMAYSDEKLPGT